MVRQVVTAYSGNSFPSYAPNPIFQHGYESGEVEVEHWSILTLGQRMEAAARGLPAVVTGSVAGSDLAANDAFTAVDSPFGAVGLVAPLAPDVALLPRRGGRPWRATWPSPNRSSKGCGGAWAARRGVVATVEAIVDDLDGLGHRVRIPAHRVLAVVEAPSAPIPGAATRPGCRWPATARTSPSGSTPPPPPRGGLRRLGHGTTSSTRRTTPPTSAARATSG